MEKKLTQEEQILELFRANGGQFETKDIPYNLAFEAQRTFWTLRAKGYDIPKAEKITSNNYRYTLRGRPCDIASTNKKAPAIPVKFDDNGQGELNIIESGKWHGEY